MCVSIESHSHGFNTEDNSGNKYFKYVLLLFFTTLSELQTLLIHLQWRYTLTEQLCLYCKLVEDYA